MICLKLYGLPQASHLCFGRVGDFCREAHNANKDRRKPELSFHYNSSMYRLFPDTDPAFEELQIDLLRQAKPWKKLEMVWEMNAAVRTMLLSGLRSRHPDEPPEAIERRLADLILGADIAQRVYGPRAD